MFFAIGYKHAAAGWLKHNTLTGNHKNKETGGVPQGWPNLS